MNQQEKREFQVFAIGLLGGQMESSCLQSIDEDLRPLGRGDSHDPKMREALAAKWGVSKAGHISVAVEKRLKELFRRKSRAYKIEKMERALSKLKMIVRGDPDAFDEEYEKMLSELSQGEA